MRLRSCLRDKTFLVFLSISVCDAYQRSITDSLPTVILISWHEKRHRLIDARRLLEFFMLALPFFNKTLRHRKMLSFICQRSVAASFDGDGSAG